MNVTKALIDLIVATVAGMFSPVTEGRHHDPNAAWLITAFLADAVVWVVRFFLGIAVLVVLATLLLVWVTVKAAYEVVTSKPSR